MAVSDLFSIHQDNSKGPEFSTKDELTSCSGPRYSLGYEFEQWWAVGNVGSSRADITTQGFFFRGEFNF